MPFFMPLSQRSSVVHNPMDLLISLDRIMSLVSTNPYMVSNRPPRAWYSRFAATVQSTGFVSAKSDNSFFMYRHDNDTSYLLLHVDDIILTASSTRFLQKVISMLTPEFSMKDLGALHHFSRSISDSQCWWYFPISAALHSGDLGTRRYDRL